MKQLVCFTTLLSTAIHTLTVNPSAHIHFGCEIMSRSSRRKAKQKAKRRNRTDQIVEHPDTGVLVDYHYDHVDRQAYAEHKAMQFMRFHGPVQGVARGSLCASLQMFSASSIVTRNGYTIHQNVDVNES